MQAKVALDLHLLLTGLGCIFTHSHPLQAIPRVNSRGVMNGCVFRVASEVNVGNLGAGVGSSMGSAMHPSVVDVAG